MYGGVRGGYKHDTEEGEGGGPNQLIADRGAVHNNEENEIQTNNKQERITELKKIKTTIV